MSKKEYGKYIVTYEADNEEYPVKTISIGDGSTAFTCFEKDTEGFVGLALKCGMGKGIGKEIDLIGIETVVDLKPDIMLRFDNKESIDVAIKALQEIKSYLKEETV